MQETILAFMAGGFCGAFFAIVRLPIPAPPVFAGIAGIIGVWAGFVFIGYMRGV